MLDKLRTIMEEAKSRAKRFDSIQRCWPNWSSSETPASSNCSAKFATLRSVCESSMRWTGESYGKDYNVFGGQKKTIGQALRKVAPDLDAKKPAKYASGRSLSVAKMPPGGNVKAFVRKNDGLNGCVAKEKKSA